MKTLVPQPHRHARSDIDERRIETDPGGYHTYPQSLEQFSVSDERTPAQVEADIRREGYEVVWKDWDKIFD